MGEPPVQTIKMGKREGLPNGEEKFRGKKRAQLKTGSLPM